MAEMKPIGIDQTTGQQRAMSDGDTIDLGARIKIKVVRTGDYSNQPNQVLQLYDWDASPDLLSEPASQAVSFTAGIAWSPNGEFLIRTTGGDTNLYQSAMIQLSHC